MLTSFHKSLLISCSFYFPYNLPISYLQLSNPPFFPQRIKAVAAPVRGGASSRPADHRGPKDLSCPLDPNGNKGLLMKAPTHTIVETMM